VSQTRIAGVLGLQCCWLWLARVIGIQAGVNVPVIFAQDVRKALFGRRLVMNRLCDRDSDNRSSVIKI